MKLVVARTAEGDRFQTGFQTYLHFFISFLITLLKYIALFVLLFLLASNETANPRIGKVKIEFYSIQFRRAIQPIMAEKDTSFIGQMSEKFYEERQFMPAWTLNFQTNNDFEALTTLLKNANYYGFFPSQYHYLDLIKLRNKLNGGGTDTYKMIVRCQLESLATEAAFRFMINLAMGVGITDTSLTSTPLVTRLPQYLNKQLGTNNLRGGLLAVQPDNIQYKQLQRGLVKFLNTVVLYNDNYTIRQLRGSDSLVTQILVKQGYLDPVFASDNASFTIALRNFQKTNALKPTGEIDRRTLKALTVSTEKKFYKIVLNLDRMRKDALKNHSYILVNIPEFKLHYYDEHGKRTDFPVVVGKAKTPTPIVTSKIEQIVANPFWTVPRSITVKEILPRLKHDSTYLQRNGFEVIDNSKNPVDISSFDWKTLNADNFKYWFRQKYSSRNALGLIKFLFPNDYSVYLHDTPSKSFFSREVRAYSHGCIRVKNPEKLAEKILKDNEENGMKINLKKLISKKEHKDIDLEHPFPIFIRYNTCSADSEGNIHFYPDIYSQDKKAIQQFFANADYPL